MTIIRQENIDDLFRRQMPQQGSFGYYLLSQRRKETDQLTEQFGFDWYAQNLMLKHQWEGSKADKIREIYGDLSPLQKWYHQKKAQLSRVKNFVEWIVYDRILGRNDSRAFANRLQEQNEDLLRQITDFESDYQKVAPNLPLERRVRIQGMKQDMIKKYEGIQGIGFEVLEVRDIKRVEKHRGRMERKYKIQTLNIQNE